MINLLTSSENLCSLNLKKRCLMKLKSRTPCVFFLTIKTLVVSIWLWSRRTPWLTGVRRDYLRLLDLIKLNNLPNNKNNNNNSKKMMTFLMPVKFLRKLKTSKISKVMIKKVRRVTTIRKLSKRKTLLPSLKKIGRIFLKITEYQVLANPYLL